MGRKEALMANRLKMATVQSILTLHERGWSQRRIAVELGVDRETVSRYAALARQAGQAAADGISNPANAPIPRPGSAALSNPASPSLEPGRKSSCEPWREVIEAQQAQGLSARRIYQDLVAEHGAQISYHSVRRFLRKLGWTRPLPFRRLESAPGQEAQVDFGTGAPIELKEGELRAKWENSSERESLF
jgi:transposase